MRPERIVTVVVNWNGWRDTLTCVESMHALTGPPFELLICDNGSGDGSYEHLCAWARQALDAASETVSSLGSGEHVLCCRSPQKSATAHSLQAVYVMKLARNAGYAGAINRCIEWSRGELQPTAFWLLNNDVRLQPDALFHLVACARSAPDAGLCGSVLLEWDDPERVQAIGGVFRWMIGVGAHLKRLPRTVAPGQPLFRGIDYPVGASLFVITEFIDAVGLMDDSYFLYFEEMDWVERGRVHGFVPVVALNSKVRHKQGASTGSTGVRSQSMLSEYYSVLNRLRFIRKFSPWRLPLVWLSLWLVLADRLLHSEWKRAAMVLRLMFRPGSVARP